MLTYYQLTEGIGLQPRTVSAPLQPVSLGHPNTQVLSELIAITNTPPTPDTITEALNPHGSQPDEPLSPSRLEGRNPAYTPSQAPASR